MFKRLSNRRKVQASVFIAYLATISFTVYAYSSSAPPAGRAGDVPNQSCVDPTNGCHILPSNPPTPSVVLMGAPGSYIPGQTYDLTVAVSGVAGTRGGFQMVVLNSSQTNAGVFTDGPNTEITPPNTPPPPPGTRQYISHKGAPDPNPSTNRRNWTFQWTAPPAGTGAVTFFVAGLAALDNFVDRTNDVIANITQTSQEAIRTVSIGDAQATEGNTGTLAATFPVSLSFPSSQTVTVNVSTANNTATAPADYDSIVNQQVSIPAGMTSQNVTVNVRGDTIDEPTETFFVNLSTPSGATLGDSQGVGTIIDNDPTPSISINDVSLNEGNSGTSNANFVVSLSNARSQTITVNFATANGTATAPADYAANSGTVTFNPGVTQQTVTVIVNGDTTDEPGETFFVNLTSPSLATISDSQGQATILNDDLSCNYTINPMSRSFAASGGVGTIDVTAPGGCAWTAESNNPDFITITGGGSGNGNGTVMYSIGVNSSTDSRAGTITVAGLTFTLLQGAAFFDVPQGHPFYNEIGKLSARGVTLGCGGGNYCPDDPVTRGQMAAFIIRALGEFNPPPPAQQRFLDVPPSDPFYAFIEQMAVRQITLGCGGDNYCPADPVLREQMAAFILRGLGEFNPPDPPFQRFLDVPPTNGFYRFIDRMAVLGITQGCGGGNYCPTQPVTRGQMAAFLVRAFNL